MNTLCKGVLNGIHFLMFSLLVACNALPSSAPPTREIMPSDSFELLWSRSEIESYNIAGVERNEIFVRIWEDNVFILNWDRTWPQSHTFKKFDLLTDEVKWEVPLQNRTSAISSNSHHIYSSWYIGTPDRKPPGLECGGMIGDPKWDPGCDAIQVDAFDMVSGDITWSQVYTSMASIAHMFADDSLLKISGSGGQGAYEADLTIDAFTGDLMVGKDFEEFSKPDYAPLLFAVRISPSSIVSNFAAGEGIVYFLTTNGELWAVDESEGMILGKQRFAGAENQTMSVLGNFRVTAEKNIVVVYLDDSRQLFAFRFLPERRCASRKRGKRWISFAEK